MIRLARVLSLLILALVICSPLGGWLVWRDLRRFGW